MKLISATNKKCYVHIQLKGHKSDNEKYTTKAGSNVFNPVWKEEV